MAFLNPYEKKLNEFPELILANEQSFVLRSSWQKRFSQQMGSSPKRVVLEIGCSNAFFLSDLALANRDTAFVGMDWKYKIIYKGAKKVASLGLKNMILLRNRAEDVSKIFGAGELDEIWIFFPDPWAKKSQLKHRIIREQFLLELHSLLKPGGKIYFKTDHPGYFQWAMSILGKTDFEISVDYSGPDPEDKSRRSKQIAVRRVELEDLPPTSNKVCDVFHVGMHSTDYWREISVPETLFKNRKTLFEALFVKDELPIYFLELEKK